MRQVVQECIGYHRHGWSRVWHILLTILTGGLFWIALTAAPPWAMFFLSQCPLRNASFVLVKVTHATLPTIIKHM